jgi:hypothetical protein
VSAAWQPLEPLKVNPEFFGGAKVTWNRSFLQRTNSKTALPKAAPPKNLGFFYAALTAVSVGRINTGADDQRARPGG